MDTNTKYILEGSGTTNTSEWIVHTISEDYEYIKDLKKRLELLHDIALARVGKTKKKVQFRIVKETTHRKILT